MDEELRKEFENVEMPPNKTKIKTNRYPPNLPPIDIAMIGAVRFHQNLQKKENVLFSISLYEIDRIIKEKQALKNKKTDE